MARAAALGLAGALALAGCRTDLKNTAAPPGDVQAYQPFAHLAQVLAFAGPDAKLIEMTAVGVASNGTMQLPASASTRVDHRLTARDTQGRYVDVRVEIHAPRDVSVSSGDLDGLESTSPKRHLGMRREVFPFNGLVPQSLDQSAVALPKCSAADLWKQSLAAGAPADQLATIVYGAAGYELRVLKPKYVSIRFDHDCTLRKPP